MSTPQPDLADIHRRFQSLPPGAKAELRRAATPEELRTTPGLYRLFPGERPTGQQLRLAFLVPWCDQMKSGHTFTALCADKIAEARIIQIARSATPQDLVMFRRLITQLGGDVGWLDIAGTLFYWGRKAKRQLVEDYYISLHKLDKRG